MNKLEAIKTVSHLYLIWVARDGSRFTELEKVAFIKQSIRNEIKANKEYPMRCSAGCKRETRADAIRLGKAAHALGLGKVQAQQWAPKVPCC
jgi:hypothetical protein